MSGQYKLKWNKRRKIVWPDQYWMANPRVVEKSINWKIVAFCVCSARTRIRVFWLHSWLGRAMDDKRLYMGDRSNWRDSGRPAGESITSQLCVFFLFSSFRSARFCFAHISFVQFRCKKEKVKHFIRLETYIFRLFAHFESDSIIFLFNCFFFSDLQTGRVRTEPMFCADGDCFFFYLIFRNDTWKLLLMSPFDFDSGSRIFFFILNESRKNYASFNIYF